MTRCVMNGRRGAARGAWREGGGPLGAPEKEREKKKGEGDFACAAPEAVASAGRSKLA